MTWHGAQVRNGVGIWKGVHLGSECVLYWPGWWFWSEFGDRSGVKPVGGKLGAPQREVAVWKVGPSFFLFILLGPTLPCLPSG
jgi:hypothetical protein